MRTWRRSLWASAISAADSACPTATWRSTPRRTSSRRTAGRREQRRQTANRAFLSDLRDLKSRRPHRARGPRHRHVCRAQADLAVGAGEPPQDFMELRYPGEDKLFVPVERLDLVQKYTGAAPPPLDRLGGTTWEKAKTTVKKAMRDMAEELLKLYAARKAVAGPRVSADTHWQQEFEDAFPYDADAGSGHGDRRHQARHGIADADGPAALRRRRLRQDRSGHARRVQGRDGRQAGRGPRADDGPRVSAPEDAARALRGIPRAHRHGEPLPHQGGAEGRRSTTSRPGGSTSSSARTGCSRRTCSSATSACWSSTRSSASAWRTRSSIKQMRKKRGRADDDGHADSAHAEHVAGRHPRHVGDRDAAEGPAGDPDQRREVRFGGHRAGDPAPSSNAAGRSTSSTTASSRSTRCAI